MLKAYLQALRSVEIGQTTLACATHVATALLCLLWVLVSPFVALYALRRPTQFWQFTRWLND